MTVVVAAIIQDKEGRFLCAKRGDWKSEPNKWEFPGGKIEPGESPEQALVRELQEELDASIKVIREFHRNQLGGIELVTYACEIIGDKPTSSSDHSELRWATEEEMATLDWAEADIPAVKKILIPFC
jgi:8-oxo-dGTP diphosphatase